MESVTVFGFVRRPNEGSSWMVQRVNVDWQVLQIRLNDKNKICQERLDHGK